MSKKEFLMGNEVIVKAALAAGAEMLCGYPITPATEILTFWTYEQKKNKKLLFLQTEDEIAAGFGAIGGVLAGKKTFTATAGPGTVLMQDPLSMAEAMRLPIVAVICQRGGPSTGTVIYSQQEVTLVGFGGNGEGLRIVYSPSNLQELYDFVILAFNTAWKYRFPTFVLTDGYLSKQKGAVQLKKPRRLVKTKNLLGYPSKFVNLRNCFDLEEELNEYLEKDIAHFEEMARDVADSEDYKLRDAEIAIFSHGIVSAAAKVAVDELRKERIKAGVFRPITLRPLDWVQARNAVHYVKKILIVESAYNQLGRLIKDAIYGSNKPVFTYPRPALGITPEMIIDKVKEII
jgi:2-oxoglutarate ferredoxin oxidoreductase subunit alpha